MADREEAVGGGWEMSAARGVWRRGPMVGPQQTKTHREQRLAVVAVALRQRVVLECLQDPTGMAVMEVQGEPVSLLVIR